MMRTIKFRAWDKAVNSIYDGENPPKRMTYYSDLFVSDDGFIQLDCVGQPAMGDSGQERFELMQFTGLKDRNGTEIYEGDILKNPEYHLVVIIWNQSDAEFLAVDVNEYPKPEPTYQTNDIWVNMEVIGNIYENPELLTSE